jgi:hypothetical protein
MAVAIRKRLDRAQFERRRHVASRRVLRHCALRRFGLFVSPDVGYTVGNNGYTVGNMKLYGSTDGGMT